MIITVNYHCQQILLDLGPFPGKVIDLPVFPGSAEVGQELVSNLGFLLEILGNGRSLLEPILFWAMGDVFFEYMIYAIGSLWHPVEENVGVHMLRIERVEFFYEISSRPSIPSSHHRMWSGRLPPLVSPGSNFCKPGKALTKTHGVVLSMAACLVNG